MLSIAQRVDMEDCLVSNLANSYISKLENLVNADSSVDSWRITITGIDQSQIKRPAVERAVEHFNKLPDFQSNISLEVLGGRLVHVVRLDRLFINSSLRA